MLTALQLLYKGKGGFSSRVFRFDFFSLFLLFSKILSFSSLPGACLCLTVPTLGSAVSSSVLQQSKLSSRNEEKCFLVAPSYQPFGATMLFCLSYFCLWPQFPSLVCRFLFIPLLKLRAARIKVPNVFPPLNLYIYIYMNLLNIYIVEYEKLANFLLLFYWRNSHCNWRIQDL